MMLRFSCLALLLILSIACGGAPVAVEREGVLPTAVASATSFPPADTALPATVPPTETALPPTTIPPTTVPATAAPETAVPTATFAPTETSPAPTLVPTLVPISLRYNTALILDASGSMLNLLDGKTRLAVAQEAVASLSAALPSSMHASLWAYGHRVEQTDMDASCNDIEEVIPLGTVDARAFERAARGLAAKGYTPITDSLLAASDSLPVGPGERNSIVLISDGEETCGGDPCALAESLANGDKQIRIEAIGLAVDDFTRAQLTCIAEVSGGTYHDADTAEALAAALEGAAEAAADDAFSLVEGLGRPSNVLVSPDNRHVYVTGTVQESVLAFERDELTGRVTYLGRVRNREGGVTGMDSPLGMAITPDGAHIYVTGDQERTVITFARDGSTGLLTYVDTMTAFEDDLGLERIFGVAVSPDGAHVYVLGQDFARSVDALAVLAREAATGRVTRTQLLRSGDGEIGGLGEATDLVVSHDGRHVYTTGEDRRIGVFERDATSGALAFVAELREGIDVDRGLLGGKRIVMSPDDRFVYVTARRPGAITVFDRAAADGRLTFNSQILNHAGDRPASSELFNLYGAHGLAIAPDGSSVYVGGGINDFLVVLERDAASGGLNFVEDFRDDTAGVDGLRNAYDVAISPDGRSVYVVGFDDDGMAVFQRDSATGRLVFVAVVRNRE